MAISMSVSSTSIPPNLIKSSSTLVSLAVTPGLLTILTIRATGELLEQLGAISEEIFRGDRLPLLHLPASETASIE
jgi:hypothetical protein